MNLTECFIDIIKASAAGLEDALRSGMGGTHAAWDFHGRLWFADGLFHEEVWTYRVPRKIVSAPSLRELMEAVNAEFGYG